MRLCRSQIMWFEQKFVVWKNLSSQGLNLNSLMVGESKRRTFNWDIIEWAQIGKHKIQFAVTTSWEWDYLFDTVSVFHTGHVQLVEITKENNSAVRVSTFYFQHQFLQINKNHPGQWIVCPLGVAATRFQPTKLQFIVHNIQQNLEMNVISNIHACCPMLAGLSIESDDVEAQNWYEVVCNVMPVISFTIFNLLSSPSTAIAWPPLPSWIVYERNYCSTMLDEIELITVVKFENISWALKYATAAVKGPYIREVSKINQLNWWKLSKHMFRFETNFYTIVL